MKTLSDVLSSSGQAHVNTLQQASWGSTDLRIFPRSVQAIGSTRVLMGRLNGAKKLFCYDPGNITGEATKLQGTPVDGGSAKGQFRACDLTHANAAMLQKILFFARPRVVGLRQSFGFGDRLGVANPGHVRSLEKSGFVPVLAQQSIRELTRTQREAEEVMDAAIWAVVQEGYTKGFGADADHLKTTADIDRMVKAGFTMFTFDPSEFVVNEADTLDEQALVQRAKQHPWGDLQDTLEALIGRYESKAVTISKSFSLTPTRLDVLRAVVKYGGSLAHIKRLNDHLRQRHPGHPKEIEVSVDETESVTSPFEHFFMASELQRLKVEIVSLAPRFIGDFEKGIDYKGSLDIFKEEYLRHVDISEFFGSYKISFHSGSDKFGVYETVGKTGRGRVHVKTAGTSYLEALKVAAFKDTGLFREILDFSHGLFEQEKASYHVSAQLSKVQRGSALTDEQLPGLFTSDDARQVLHVTFGKVLTSADTAGMPLFKERLLACLDANEDLHYEILVKHFKRHLDPLEPLTRT